MVVTSRLVLAVSPGSRVRQKIWVVAVWPLPANVLMIREAKVCDEDWAVIVDLRGGEVCQLDQTECMGRVCFEG